MQDIKMEAGRLLNPRADNPLGDFNRFPNEVMWMIFNYLQADDLASMKLLSKQIHTKVTPYIVDMFEKNPHHPSITKTGKSNLSIIYDKSKKTIFLNFLKGNDVVRAFLRNNSSDLSMKLVSLDLGIMKYTLYLYVSDKKFNEFFNKSVLAYVLSLREYKDFKEITRNLSPAIYHKGIPLEERNAMKMEIFKSLDVAMLDIYFGKETANREPSEEDLKNQKLRENMLKDHFLGIACYVHLTYVKYLIHLKLFDKDLSGLSEDKKNELDEIVIGFIGKDLFESLDSPFAISFKNFSDLVSDSNNIVNMFILPHSIMLKEKQESKSHFGKVAANKLMVDLYQKYYNRYRMLSTSFIALNELLETTYNGETFLMQLVKAAISCVNKREKRDEILSAACNIVVYTENVLLKNAQNETALDLLMQLKAKHNTHRNKGDIEDNGHYLRLKKHLEEKTSSLSK